MEALKKLVAYGLKTNLIGKEDIVYTVNSLLIALDLDSADYEVSEIEALAGEVPEDESLLGAYLETVLKELDDYAAKKELIESDSVVYRDLFDTKLMGLMTDRPGNIIKNFEKLYEESPQKATDFYYNFSLIQCLN